MRGCFRGTRADHTTPCQACAVLDCGMSVCQVGNVRPDSDADTRRGSLGSSEGARWRWMNATQFQRVTSGIGRPPSASPGQARRRQQALRRTPRAPGHRPLRRGRRGRRGHRSLGLGQVDAVPGDQPARDRSTPGRSGRRPPAPRGGQGLAQLRADVGMVFQSFNLFAHKTMLENVTLGPIKVRGMQAKAARRARWSCSSGWASPTRRRRCPPSSRAGSSSASRSPVRSRCSPRSCSSTSPPRRSTPR